MTVNEIYKAIENGKIVNWTNSFYEVKAVEFELNEYTAHTFRDGLVLEIICISNYFGGVAHPDELKDCFIKE